MYRPARGIRLRSSARSDRGRVRQNNEDSVDLWPAESSVLAVVADGMGGAVAGEEASRIAVETIRGKLVNDSYRSPESYNHYDEDKLAELLGEAVREANQKIIDKAHKSPELKGMGTTVTLVFARFSDVILAHVGDSRAYYVDSSDESISQLTADHSFVQALVDAGHITEAEAAEHPMKNVLYRALGQAEDLDVDVTQDVHIHAGDRLVLCSDGLTLHVSPDEIKKAALDGNDPNTIADKLIEMANSRGGKDNVSVIVIVVDEAEYDPNETEAMSPLDLDFEIGGDNEPTLPINPDYFNVTRVRKPMDEVNGKDDPQATHEMPSAGTYGEGKDSNPSE
jgi:serine/threonine protein phosphatase PrpC